MSYLRYAMSKQPRDDALTTEEVAAIQKDYAAGMRVGRLTRKYRRDKRLIMCILGIKEAAP